MILLQHQQGKFAPSAAMRCVAPTEASSDHPLGAAVASSEEGRTKTRGGAKRDAEGKEEAKKEEADDAARAARVEDEAKQV